MATQNGVNYALQADPTGANQLAPGLNGGRVRCVVDQFTFAGEAAGEIIRIAKLPIGARVLQIAISTDGLGGAVTLEVGDGNSNVLYATGVTTTAAALDIVNGTPGYEIDTAVKQIILIETADAAATGVMKTVVYYAAD